MFNATCLIKTDIDTVNKCMGQNPYNPETFLQNFASRLTSFDDPLLNIYPTSEIAGNIEDEDVILGLREPQKLIEWAKTMKERTQCMAMAEFSAALQKHKAEGIDITKPMYTCLRSIEMDSNESYLLRYAAELLDNHPNPECGELFYDGDSWKCFPDNFQLKDIEAAHLNEEGSFDCGFIFWYPKADSQLEKDMSLLVGANRRKLSWLDIAVPTFSQSINVQRYGAELIKKLVKERLGIELYYRSELD